MTYQEALRYLESFINYEKTDSYDYKKSFKLERMEKLARDFKDPQLKVRAIHVAGTKGKGSTCAITHSILKEEGFKTGLYTSPHLESFRERVRVNDSCITDDAVTQLVSEMKPVIEKMSGPRPSFFEVYTLLAYLYFLREGVDIAVYETGLGGRLDATNVLRPLVSAITPISYEHTDKLGDTLGEIAFEKAGIIKDGSICVSAQQEKEALDVISSVCVNRKAKLISVGKDISFKEISSDEKGSVFDVSGILGEYGALECGLLGRHQISNAALSIGIIESLKHSGIDIKEDSIRRGIKKAAWPGRLEIVSRRPLVVLDGAQNRASAKVLAEAVKNIFDHKRLVLVLGVSKDKDVDGILDELIPISDSVIVTRSKILQRAMEPEKIASRIGRTTKAAVTSSVDEAMECAVSSAGADDMVLVTGSLFVVGEARHKYAKNF